MQKKWLWLRIYCWGDVASSQSDQPDPDMFLNLASDRKKIPKTFKAGLSWRGLGMKQSAKIPVI
jgi:hypothetical protein